MVFHCIHNKDPELWSWISGSCLPLHTQLLPPAPHSTTVSFLRALKKPCSLVASGPLLCYITQSFPEKLNQQEVCVCTNKERESTLKELAHIIVGSGKSVICKATSRLETHRRVDIESSSVKVFWRTNFFSRDLSLFSHTFSRLDEAHPHYVS